MEKKKPRRKISLRWSLMGLILGCWILPLIIISGTMGYYITSHINNQVVSTLSDSVTSSVKVATNRIESAMKSSKYASYDTTIRS
ncbi:MAG: hypothetical protein RR540_07470, partial [Oscillospiraceae bacterium]